MSEDRDTIDAVLLRSKSPEDLGRTAVVAPGGTLSYGDLQRLVEALGEALAGAGIEAGDRVVLLLPNSAAYIVAFLAVTARGAVVVPVDAQAGPERLRYILDDTEARLCLHEPGSPLAAALADAPPGLLRGLALDAAGRSVVLTPAEEPTDTTADPRSEAATPAKHAAAAPASQIDRSGDGHSKPETGISDPVAAIVYTAGSTGRPKGVVLHHRHFLAIARTLVSIIGMDRAHRDLIISPMTHSGGWQRVTSTLMSGGCVVIPGGTLTVPAILQSVVEHGITGFFAAPPILRAILMSPPAKVAAALSGLRSIETASAPLTPAEVERLLTLLPGTNLFVQYGLTECSRAVILDARAHPDKRTTVGRATPGVSVAIADESGRSLGPGQEGEIVLTAAQCADGYWRQPEAGAGRFRGGRLHTGDFGILDEDGFLTFLGRRDDMINCGGHSYFPKEVEAELGAPPGVKDLLVAGVPDPQKILNQVPWAFVVPAPGEEFSPTEFLARARTRLPAHMVPRRVVVVPALPLTTTGKPSRRLAVERYGPAAVADAG